MFENYWSRLVVLIKMTERVVGQREPDREKEGEWALEPFLRISEEEGYVTLFKAELCCLKGRPGTILRFPEWAEGRPCRVSNAELTLTQWPLVAGHFLVSCLLLPPSAAFGYFIPVCQLFVSWFCPFRDLFSFCRPFSALAQWAYELAFSRHLSAFSWCQDRHFPCPSVC